MNSNQYENISGFNRYRNSRKKIDLILRIYSLMGLLIAVLAGGYFVLTLLPFKLSNNQQIALMFIGVGIALAFMSRTLIILRKERDISETERLKEYQTISEFLGTWSQFEIASKEALRQHDKDVNIHSLRAVISKLHEEEKIDNADVQALDEALHTRNEIVHGNRPLSSIVARQVTDTLLEIIKKISLPV